MRLTLSIVSRTLLSLDLGGFGAGDGAEARELGRSFDLAVEEVGQRTLDLSPLAGLLPTAKNQPPAIAPGCGCIVVRDPRARAAVASVSEHGA